MDPSDYEIIDNDPSKQQVQEFASSILSSEARSEHLNFEDSQKQRSPTVGVPSNLLAESEDPEERSESLASSDALELSLDDPKKSEGISRSVQESPVGSLISPSIFREDRILDSGPTVPVKAQKAKREASEFEEVAKEEEKELFGKILKQHYFVAVFGIFSLYQVVINLVDYLKSRSS